MLKLNRMRGKKLILPLVVVVVILNGCSSNKKQEASNDASFEKFREYYVESLWKISPSSAIYAGFHQYDSLLIIPNDENKKNTISYYNALMDSLKQFDESKLSDLNKIDLWMMRDNIEASLWYINSFKSNEWNPANFNIAGDFAEILNGKYDNLDNRLRVFSKRLENVPAYYQAAKLQVKTPTIEHTDLAILQNEGSIEEVFGASLKDSVAKSTLSEVEKQQLLTGADAAKNAMLDFASFLKEMRKTMTPENSRSFRIGKELYEDKFKFDIVSGYSASELYTKSVNRKAELHHEMAVLSRTLWPKYFGSASMPTDSLQLIRRMIDTLSVKHVHRDSFLQSIEQQIPNLVKFISDKDLIYIDPSKPLVVRKTPAYMEGSGAGASISAPGPYDKNANTYYNVSPLTGYTPGEAESYLREYNYYILQILNIHEAIPGHYTQLVYSNQSPSIIKSVLGNGAMVEGWAVYTERMMLENGYGNNEPEMWLMYYKWHLRSVCNTILDYSVHVNGMTEKDAMKLLVDGAFQQTAEAAGKWRRVKLSSVQLTSYFNGFSEIYDLREELKKNGDFDLKKFHEKFLSYGSAPVKYIKGLMMQKSEVDKH
jgi:uncharacterized protein (DUF885 family)